MKEKNYELNSIITTQRNYIRFNYEIEKEFEAGLILQGWEVKSLRVNRINIRNNYISIINNEAYLLNTTFNPTITSLNRFYNIKRNRKLLLNRNELNFLYTYKSTNKGCTIVAISLYWKKFLVKVNIGAVKSKKNHDKRKNIRDREWIIDKERILKYNNKY